ncbi:sulfotransferase family protein [Smaragdicoccus niigatensis]|uniref:sulfotransferase family protein n=1 Tax=Smaragdicoccus niigatensis TaxID=359359 RepID=UPI00035DF765|nr:sulfotransferase [Smaragdicoccus niigatensis]
MPVRTELRRPWRKWAPPAPRPFTVDRTVWIFGCGRSGSTWLAEMLNSFDGWSMWPEPGFGHIFQRPEPAAPYVDSPCHVMGGEPELHQPAVRAFVDTAIKTRFPHLTASDVMVLKDQNASGGCGEISAALPDSRFVALIRDPRDVLASIVDALSKPTSWAADPALSVWIDQVRDPAYTSTLYASICTLLEITLATYETHPGPKSLIRYEDLRTNTAPTMRRLFTELDLLPTAPSVDEVTDRHAFERIPVEETGSGKFYRSASPGGWRETLPADFAPAVDVPMPPLLSPHYPND